MRKVYNNYYEPYGITFLPQNCKFYAYKPCHVNYNEYETSQGYSLPPIILTIIIIIINTLSSPLLDLHS